MSTGAMTGADAPALRALAAQMSQSAGRLDAIRQGIRGRLYSVHWDGPDGANFRRMWDGQHVPLLAAVAEGLRNSAERLLAEADQQESASGSGAGGAVGPFAGQTMGPSTGRIDTDGGDFPDNPFKPLGWLLGGAATYATLMTSHLANQVPAHLRNGTYVQEYWRWNAGQAGRLNGLVGSADDMADAARRYDRFAKPVSAVGAVFDFGDQWQDDRDGGYGTGERATRAGFAAAAPLVVERAGMQIGAVLGTALIPIPGVGTVIGGALGWAAATVLSEVFDEQLSEAAADLGSAVWDAGEAVVDVGGDVLEAGGDLLGDIGEGAADLWEDLTPW